MMSTINTSTDSSQLQAPGVCPICHGAGFLRRDVPVDDPDFGRAIPCECKTRETQLADLAFLRLTSGLSHLNQMTFDSFRTEGIGLNPDQKRNLVQASERAREFAASPEGWLVFKGGYGCGKTHLAAAIANERLGRGQPVLFVVVPDLLDHLRAAFSPSSRSTYDDRFEGVKTTPFLILDDLGAQAPTAWAQEKLFQLLNYRYNADLPTVITTNRELEEIDARVRSRLADRLCTIVGIQASDFRQGGGGIDTDASAMSNLGLYADMRFDTFDLRGDELKGDARENLRRVFHIAKNFVENPSGFIVFTGEYGCGKTHLAAAIANELRDRGQTVVFALVPNLLDHLRATFSPDSLTSYDKRFEETRTAPFLVLDDLGTENATQWAREKLFQIIDYRYVARLPTIITISREPEGRLEESGQGQNVRIDRRIQTRIFDLGRSSVCEILAPTYRLTHRSTQSKPENGYRRTRR